MLTQGNPCFSKDLRRCVVHTVRQVIHDLAHPYLHDLDATSGKWTCIAVKNSSISYAFFTGLQEGIHFGMQAKTFIQSLPAPRLAITSRTTSLVTVGQAARRSIISGRDDTIITDEDSPYSAFHAVGS